MQKITPHLWFDNNCEEAINFYVSVFKNSKIIHVEKYPVGMQEEHMKGMEGKVLTGIFELEGQRYMALDGGPLFKFNESISFVIDCVDQAEVDYYWEKLSAHPENEQCGWVKDRFGLSWQIVPKRMGELMMSASPEQAKRVMTAMLKMKKIIVADLEAAYA